MRAFVIGVLLIAVIAASGWYVWKENPEAVRGMSLDTEMAAVNANAGPAMEPGAETASGSGPVAASDAQLGQWRQEMKAACTAGDKALHIEQFDVNGDNRADTVCWRIVKTDTTYPYVEVEARVKTASGAAQMAHVLVPMTGANEQFGVCGPPEALRVEQAKWTKQQFEDMDWDDLGRVSIAITGGDCDTPWLFWPKDAKGEEVTFDFARM